VPLVIPNQTKKPVQFRQPKIVQQVKKEPVVIKKIPPPQSFHREKPR